MFKKNTNYFYAVRISISLAILSEIFIKLITFSKSYARNQKWLFFFWTQCVAVYSVDKLKWFWRHVYSVDHRTSGCKYFGTCSFVPVTQQNLVSVTELRSAYESQLVRCHCSLLQVSSNFPFLPRDAMHSADCAFTKCLSVRLSHAAAMVLKRLNVSVPSDFHRRVATQF